MPTSFSTLWTDPVWSKVIATAIWTCLASIVVAIFGKKKREFFPLRKMLSVRIPSWILLLSSIVVLIVNIATPRFSVWSGLAILTLSFVVTILYYNRVFEAKTEEGKSEEVQENVFFNSESAPVHSLAAHFEQDWVKNTPVGEKAIGEFSFKEKTINIVRSNSQGRVIIRIERYNGSSPYYIRKKVASNGKRFIIVNFDGKVVGGIHKIWVVIRYAGKSVWINNAYKILEVSRENWEPFTAVIPIPPTEDIEVHLEDRGLVTKNTSIQLKNLSISEPID